MENKGVSVAYETQPKHDGKGKIRVCLWHSGQGFLLEIDVKNYDTFDNNLQIEIDFTRHFKGKL